MNARALLASTLTAVCCLLPPANAVIFAQQPIQTSAAESAYESRLAAKFEELIKLNGVGTDQELAKRLLKMREEDQGIRQPLMDQGSNSLSMEQKTKLFDAMNATDVALTSQLKEIVAAKGWPTIALVGMDGSRAAALVLTHTPDHAWQKSLLPGLQDLVQQNKITGDDIAVIVDKNLKADGKPQRFGSQFDVKDGAMTMWPVEDPAHLDALREQYLLPPMEEYKKIMAQLYHVKVQ